MSDHIPFINKVLSGEITNPHEGIDDEIDRWHELIHPNITIYDWLGFSWEEYAKWVQNPDSLNEIIESFRTRS